MKKICIFAAILPLLILTLAGVALATDQELAADQAEALETERIEHALPSDAKKMLDGVDSASVNLDNALGGIFESLNRQLGGIVSDAVRSAVMLIIISVLCAVAAPLHENGPSSSKSFVPIVGVLAICGVIAGDVNGLMNIGRSVITTIDTFSKTLLPTLTAAIAASGSPMQAAARHAATMLFSDVLLTTISRFFFPLVYIYIALCAANAAVGNNILSRMCSFIKWLCIWSLSLMLTGFISYLTITGIISGGADALAIKGARFAISNVIPVVGGIVSDAAETVITSTGILKNSIGVFGMLGIIATCIVPFLQLAARYIVFKIAAALSGTLNDERIAGFIDNLAGAFALILAMSATSALLIIISIASAISAVSPV